MKKLPGYSSSRQIALVTEHSVSIQNRPVRGSITRATSPAKRLDVELREE
ncbi:hypothetical protein [Nonomuraea diastatica]|nr:hypothetical protein [Nonomuraea diastatica]